MKKRKARIHIVIMSIIGILYSAFFCLSSGPKEIISILGKQPLLFILAFLVTKHPLFGILYTINFSLTLISVYIGESMLSFFVFTLLFFYFIYVDALSYQYNIKVKRDKKIKKLTEE